MTSLSRYMSVMLFTGLSALCFNSMADDAPPPDAAPTAEVSKVDAPAKVAKAKKKAKAAVAAPAVAAAAPASEAVSTPPAAEAAAAPAAADAKDAAPAADAAAAPAADAAAAPAADAAAAPPPKCGDKGFECNKGDIAWMMTSTAFVLLMTVPGLALFYMGMVRTKNALSTVMQSFSIFCVIAVLWVVYGYSLAFTAGHDGTWYQPFIGSLDKLFMKGDDPTTAVAATFSKGVYLPDYVYCMFQLTFAAITVALICGGYAERFKFKAMILFSILWFTFAYLPVAHMVWYWDGPDAYTDAKAGDLAATHAGFIFNKGALDFAGGTVVHINSGIAALVCALFLGKRSGLGKVHFAPHSLMMTAVGTGMLWMGWFGFNAGSALESTGAAGLAFFNTLFGTAVAGCTWAITEWLLKGKPSLLGVCSGIVAGLVAITPAAGFVGPLGALITCGVAGVVCLLASTKVKQMLGYDDALDTFGVHCIGGIIGSLGTGIFVNPAFGGTGVYDYVANKVADFDAKAQIISQLWDIGITLFWSALVAAVVLTVLKYTIGIRSTEEQEEEGLDLADHGEKAYNY
ncbi:MAG: ammonium transporter [Nevskia sp.]|nr:ammonium transporter [Nevskia sp.]